MKSAYKNRTAIRLLCLLTGVFMLISAICCTTAAAAQSEDIIYQSSDRYRYSSISEISNSTYNKLAQTLTAGWLAGDESINISGIDISTDDIEDVYYKILFDNPDFFFVRSAFSYGMRSGKITTVYPLYLYEGDELQEKWEEYSYALSSILSYIDDDMSDYAKALTLHDILAIYCEYDSNYYSGAQIAAESYTAYGALVNNVAVCQGYSLAYKALLDRCSISSTFADSEELTHIWNMIKLDSNYYHVDVTWDDNRVNIGNKGVLYDVSGKVNHKYFLMSDSYARNNQHTSWDSKVTASSAKYDSDFSHNAKNARIYSRNGYFYYINTGGEIIKRNESTGSESILYTIENGKWNQVGTKYSVWDAATARIAADEDTVYFNITDSVMKLDLATENVSSAVKPDIENSECIYGLAFFSGKLYYDKRTADNVLEQYIPLDIEIVSTDYSFDVVFYNEQGAVISADELSGDIGTEFMFDIVPTKGNYDIYSVVSSDESIVTYDVLKDALVLTGAGRAAVTFTAVSDTNCSVTATVKCIGSTDYSFEITLYDENGEEISGDVIKGEQGGEISLDISSALGYSDTYSVDISNEKVAYYDEDSGKIVLANAGQATVTVTSKSDSNYYLSFIIEVTDNTVYGDANSDGKVTAADVLIIRKYLAKWNVTPNEKCADANADGKITAADVLLIRKYLAKWKNIELGSQA